MGLLLWMVSLSLLSACLCYWDLGDSGAVVVILRVVDFHLLFICHCYWDKKNYEAVMVICFVVIVFLFCILVIVL